MDAKNLKKRIPKYSLYCLFFNFIAAIVSSPGVVKSHPGASAELVWGLNIDFRNDTSFDIQCSSAETRNLVAHINISHYYPVVSWQNEYGDRADLIFDVIQQHIGIQLHNISSADALQYTLSFGHDHSDDATIYVFSK